MKAMYKLILLPVVLIVFLGEAYANDYNVVFDITSSDKKDWQSLLNNLENVKKSVGSASQLEVVVHGGALGILLKKTGFQVERMRKIAASGFTAISGVTVTGISHPWPLYRMKARYSTSMA